MPVVSKSKVRQFAEARGLKIRDAKNSIKLNVVKADVQKSFRSTPGHCMFAESCRRETGAQHVLFFRGVSYVSDASGRFLERRINSGNMKDAIDKFDKSKAGAPLGEYTLRAPSPKESLIHQRERNSKVPQREGTGSPKRIRRVVRDLRKQLPLD